MHRNKKTIAIIQARTGSKRLPNKVILPIAGKPSLHYVIERTKRSKYIDKIILATTTNKSDDQLEQIAKTANIEFFRGEEEDVIERFTNCLNSQPEEYDYLVRVNADNFLICPEIIDLTLEEII